ncbi:aldehyde dehydrogenase family protein [Microbacterium sp. R86528]|uniref:aldehyde dehydrogenase family protein n=1 Tax=Microbacterium sp. R86528 TaxID=3093864 RepID=UPI0037C9B55C
MDVNRSIFTAQGLLGPEPGHVIAGIRRTDHGGDPLPVIDPATGARVAEVPSASDALVDEAVTLAVTAQRAWARRSHTERAKVLRSIHTLLGEHAEEIARIVSVEQGKPFGDAVGEIGGAQNFFEYAISQQYRDIGEVIATESGEQLTVREVPIGVVAAILPWNFPAAIFARKVAPALMAGNAIIVKPSEFTPLSAMALAELCRRAGVPDGLLSVLCGPGRSTGSALVRHPDVGMVTMTGSTRGGREIMAQAAQKLIPVSLELGGKAPFIVFPDADIDRAAKDAVAARLWNAGQVCTCNEITYVHQDIREEFVERVQSHLAAVEPSDPFAASSTLGPLVAEREWTKVKSMVDAAVEQGATLALGGGRPEGEQFAAGNWFAPTLLTDVTEQMDITRNEVFGPVLAVTTFSTYDELITRANATPYGLSAYVYSNNLHTVMQALDDLDFGEIYVNKAGPERPQGFHTGWKASGLGGDDGTHGYERYLRRKTSYVGYGPSYGG